MTALQMQFVPHFQAPVNEDPMELTSDIDQRAGIGDDIDIDFDLTGDNPHDGEDEFMREEDGNVLADTISVDGLESHVANDDEMADDSYAQGHIDEESSVRDEDIEDADSTGPELGEDTIVEPDLDHPIEESEELFADYDEIIGNQNQEQGNNEQEYVNQEHLEQHTTPETEASVIQRVSANEQTGRVTPTHDVAEVATADTSAGYDAEVSKETTFDHAAADQSSEPSAAEGTIAPEAKLELAGEELLPASLDQEIVAPSNVTGSCTQEDDPLNSPAHLHPVVLDYQGDGMFLFPPVDQSGDHTATFLLTDEQLAYTTIGNLLEACRSVLKESLSEQDELMIKIDDLDLHISESTVESASTKFSEVVDLYVRLQQNDGIGNPPPLYMDLTSESRFSRRLDVLQNALIEGKGLSQLRLSQETENDRQHRTEEEEDLEEGPSSHTAALLSNETYASEQQPGEEPEESVDEFDSHSNQLPSENLLESDAAAPGSQSHPFTDVLHGENDLTEPQLGRNNNSYEAGTSSGLLSEAAGSKESLEVAQSLAGQSVFRREEESIVDDGDFIDYEDVEEPDGVTSSASSTLQGDGIDVNAVQDHAVHVEPLNAETQEPRISKEVRRNTVADEVISNDFVEEKDNSGVGIPVEAEQPNVAEISSQHWDDKDQSLYGQSNEEVETLENDEDADDDQHEASVQYEDSGSYNHNTLEVPADQINLEAHHVDDTKLNGGEVQSGSSTHYLQSESSGSERSFRENDQGRINQAENELEEGDGALADDDIDYVPQPSDGVDTQPSHIIDESAQTQGDDDEITYEDEEDDTDVPHELAEAETNLTTSPGSLKRARRLHEDDDAPEEDLQGAKRIRSR